MNANDVLSKEYVSIDENESVSQLLGKLRSKKSKEALVFRQKAYSGIVDERKFLKLRLDVKTKIRKILTKSPKLTKDTPIEEVARLMETSDSVLLPVFDNERIAGVVYAWDVLKQALKNEKIKQLKTKDACGRKNLVILNENDPISKAISEFKKRGINRLPVVDKKNRLIGIITPRDLLKKYYIFNLKKEGVAGKDMPKSHPAKEISIPRLPVKNEMETIISAIDLEDPLTKAIQKMLNKRTTCIIVNKMGMPETILTLNDILRLFK